MPSSARDSMAGGRGTLRIREPKPSKLLTRLFNKFNRKFFFGRLPKVKCYWNEWILDGEDAMGFSCFDGVGKLGPFKTKHEAMALAAWLNRHTDKKKRQAFDYIAFSKKTKQPIRVPYICIASFLIMFPKYTKTTLLHEMAHCHLHVLGHPYVDHGRWFDSEIRRLYRYREVRGWV